MLKTILRSSGLWVRWTHWLLLLLFLLVTLGPLAVPLAELGQAAWKGNGDLLRLALPDGRRLGLWLRSLGLAVSVAAAGTAIGILAASLFWRWRLTRTVYFRFSVLLLIVVPSYIHALAWLFAFEKFSLLFQFLGIARLAVHGWLISGWVQLMSLLPMAVGFTMLGLQTVEQEMFETARIVRSDGDAFLRVVLPLAAPTVLLGTVFLFLLSWTDYTIPSLFQTNVYALEIFAEYSASNEPVRALATAMPLLVVAALIVILSQTLVRRATMTPTRPLSPGPSATPIWPAWMRGLQYLSVILLAVQILVPLVALIAMTSSWESFCNSVSTAQRELTFSVQIGLLAGVVCLPLALAPAVMLLKDDIQSRLWWLFVTAPLAVPAPLVGIGLIATWNHPGVAPVYGSELMPILASLARFMPLAVIVLYVQLRRIDPLLIDAARILPVAPVRIWLQIYLPLIALGLLAAGFLVFLLSLGELGATLLVVPPGRSTLTMRIYNYLHYGASEAVAGLSLTMLAITIASGLLLLRILSSRSRHSGRTAYQHSCS